MGDESEVKPQTQRRAEAIKEKVAGEAGLGHARLNICRILIAKAFYSSTIPSETLFCKS